MTAFRWGPQEEDTQKYKRKQKLYLSDRVSSSSMLQNGAQCSACHSVLLWFELLLMPHSHDAHIEI